MKTIFIPFVVLGMVSCAAPKATVIAEVEVEAPPKKEIIVVTAPEPKERRVTAATDDGLRLGDDILALPNDEQLRPSTVPSGEGDSTVITRPPVE